MARTKRKGAKISAKQVAIQLDILQREHDDYVDLFKKKLNDAKNALAIQGSDGNWNTDEYMFGMFNGMELIVSIFEGREPKYRTRNELMADGEPFKPEKFITHFMKLMVGKEHHYPNILYLINQKLISKLSRDADVLAEQFDVAKKRLAEANEAVNANKTKH